MTQREILNVAIWQSAEDLSCAAEDFLKKENVVVFSKPSENARRYLTLPFSCQLVSYGNNIVAAVMPALADIVREYIDRFEIYHCFETPNMLVLQEKLRPFGLDICFMAEYFLPELEKLRSLPCPFSLRVLTPADFAGLYLPEWSNALCEKRRHLDMLAVGAYDGETLVGLAGCSADCETMWQIGVDVLPAYRKQGIASALTSRLALETLDRGKVPFYCCAWSNIASARNAIRSGFRPAWVEMTAKPGEFIKEMNES
jgi:GNAT superfamily N-acetyltransferase